MLVTNITSGPPHIHKTAVLSQKKVARDKRECTAQQSSAKKSQKCVKTVTPSPPFANQAAVAEWANIAQTNTCKKDTSASSMWSLQVSDDANSKLRTHMRRSHHQKLLYSGGNHEIEIFRSLSENVSSSIACAWKVICPNHRCGAIIPISGHQLLLDSPITTTVASNPFVPTNQCKQQ